jgi:uncharacterized protein
VEKLLSERANEAAGPLRLIVLQSTSFCNIDCSYCYLPDRTNRHATMNHATLARAARLIFTSSFLGEELDVVWHAGEPLSLGPGYYDEAIRILEAERPSSTKVYYGIQTNATLIDDGWIDLFERHAIRLGISLDGPRDLHDGNRTYRNGRGTHDRTIASIRRLQKRGYPFHFIGVVTAQTLARGAELFDYYHSLAPTAFGLNVEEVEAQNRNSSLYDDASVQDYERFVSDLLERAIREGDDRLTIREFQQTMSSLISGTPEDNDQVIPLRIVNVAWNGDISTFSPELLALDNPERQRFIFGNVHDCGSLAAILDNERFIAAYTGIQLGVAKCANECEYFQYCGGGAPVNKLSEKGTLEAAETVYCRLTKKTWIDVCLRIADAPASRFEIVPSA